MESEEALRGRDGTTESSLRGVNDDGRKREEGGVLLRCRGCCTLALFTVQYHLVQ